MNGTFSCGGEDSALAAEEDLIPFSSEREEEEEDEETDTYGYICLFHVRFFPPSLSISSFLIFIF